MDKWIENFINEHRERFLKPDPETFPFPHRLHLIDLPKGFCRFVSDHLFYYELITTKSPEDSDFNFILVYRSTPFKFNVDFYSGCVFIYVVLLDKQLDKQLDYPYYLLLGKYSISDFLYNFVSGIELQENHNVDNQSFDDDQFELPF